MVDLISKNRETNKKHIRYFLSAFWQVDEQTSVLLPCLWHYKHSSRLDFIFLDLQLYSAKKILRPWFCGDVATYFEFVYSYSNHICGGFLLLKIYHIFAVEC